MGKISKLCLFAFGLSSLSLAEMELAQDLHEAGHAQRLVQAEPWILGRMSLNDVANHVQLESRNVRKLLQMAAFAEEIQRRPALEKFIIQRVVLSKERRYTLNTDFAEKLKQANLDLEAVEANLKKRLQALRQIPLNSVITGALQTLPPQLKKLGFQTKTLDGKIKFIQHELPHIADETVRAKFQGSRYGLQGENWGALDVLKLFDQALENSRSLLENILHYLYLNAEGFDEQSGWVFESEDEVLEKIQFYLERDIDQDIAWNILIPEFQHWMETFFEYRETSISKPNYELRLREIPPHVAYFRGNISYDCSTTDSAMYVYSPFERNFLIERNGEVIGHTSGTWVKVDSERCFYLHDLKGNKSSQLDLDLVLKAILENPKMFGAKKILLPTTNMVTSIGWGTATVGNVRGKETHIEYYPNDVVIRATINGMSARSTYDSTSANPTAHYPVRDFNNHFNFEVALLTPHEKKTVQKAKKEVPVDPSVQRIKNLVLILEEVALPAGTSAKEETALRKVALALTNPGKLPLAEYYPSATEALESVELTLSQKFLNKNLQLFTQGHINAPDAFTNEEPRFHKISYQIIYEYLYSNPKMAATLLKGPAQDWLKSDRLIHLFDKFISTRGGPGIQRLAALEIEGIPVVEILLGREKTKNLLHSGNNHLAAKTLIYLKRQEAMPPLEEASWIAIARLLDNEDKSQDEDWGRLALETLATAQDIPRHETIKTELRRTIKYDDNRSMRALASYAYFRFFFGEPQSKGEKKLHASMAKQLRRKNMRPEIITEEAWGEAIRATAPYFEEEEETPTCPEEMVRVVYRNRPR